MPANRPPGTTPARLLGALAWLSVSFGLGPASLGQPIPPEVAPASAPSEPDDPAVILLAAMTVIGSKDNTARMPGSAHYLDTAEIRNHGYDDINQVARRVPGVHVRQEDGYGLFPNISFRGVNTTRNTKITVMEDGILAAPATYAAPAAYYTPATGRMSGIEVLKGSAQIKYGPHTTGGVLNYLSTPIPAENRGYLSAAFGSNNDVRLHAHYGGRAQAGDVTLGFLVENAYRKTDGFKAIDATTAYPGSDQTGFERNEPMVKLRLDLRASVPQSLELKYGRTDLEADETYLGLTEDDFSANPLRRYASTRFDHITTEQERGYVRYTIVPSTSLSLVATAYANDFARSWYKLNDARLAGGVYRNLAQALAGQFSEDIMGVLRGTAAGDLRVRDNNREYVARGLELAGRARFETGHAVHLVEASVRAHRDRETRFQYDDVYSQDASGAITGVSQGVPGTQENRIGDAEALAFYLQDRVLAGRLSVTPGLRYERINYTDTRRGLTPPTLDTVISQRRESVDFWAPGIGLTWESSAQMTWLAGLHRGVSVPGPSDAAGPEQLKPEKSVGAELGARFSDRSGFNWEAILFHTAFTDLIVVNNVGGGGGVGTENIGEVDTTGLEFAAGYDLGRARGWGFSNPWTLSLTWTHARLGNDVNSAGSSGDAVESIFAGGRKGAEVPYIPDFQATIGTSLEFARWSAFVDMSYVPRTWGTANNTDNLRQGATAEGPLDSRFGRTDAYFLMNVAVQYRLSESTRLKLSVENLLDSLYVSSRVPIGPRPGAPRLWSAGMEVRF